MAPTGVTTRRVRDRQPRGGTLALPIPCAGRLPRPRAFSAPAPHPHQQQSPRVAPPACWRAATSGGLAPQSVGARGGCTLGAAMGAAGVALLSGRHARARLRRSLAACVHRLLVEPQRDSVARPEPEGAAQRRPGERLRALAPQAARPAQGGFLGPELSPPGAPARAAEPPCRSPLPVGALPRAAA